MADLVFQVLEKFLYLLMEHFIHDEKVVENAVKHSIGNINDGLYVSKMDLLLNLGRLTEKQCIMCPALQSCGICVAKIEGEEGKDFITAVKKIASM